MNGKVKTPGQILKAAREDLGKSQSDLAKMTRISVQQLQGLEEDNYDKIPAPMYVRGFIKLYAQQLGLPHEPLVEMYERMRNGESPVPETEKPMPQPEVEGVIPEVEAPQHPELPRELPRSPLKTLPRFDWQALRKRLPAFSMDLMVEWMKRPAVRVAAMGVGGLLLVLLTVKSCGGASTETETAEAPETLQVEDPYLSPPEPVYFQLPSSYQ